MDIQITAKNTDEFKKIESELKKLPEQVYSQIETAKNGLVGIECIFKDSFQEKIEIRLPKETRQIAHFGDYIGIYCEDFFFKIQGRLFEKQISYIIVEGLKTEIA
jgi:hypothetical protein